MEKITNKVLASKYRPKNFKELIGQEIMVQTITNSIKLNKLPNAYLLTGIRGTGKTTTARLIAKALNCNKDFLLEENCDCSHCEEISHSKHLDVLEMDAASKTGIDDVRELIESSKYNPTSAKYKVIILDEVHMLSKQAFNGLLKTLEEPPPHLKFIFCTTELKKIPLTIISRCQRFDLHRVTIKDLVENLKKILKIEKAQISEDAIKTIAKAAEGSVRDSLSLLSKAILIYHIEDKEVDTKMVRKMLGIADRSKILNLLRSIFVGDQKTSVEQLREMINQGLDPTNFLNDLLEIIYFIQQKKTMGTFDVELSISESEQHMIDLISKDIKTPTLIIFWQLILKVLEEISVVSNPFLSIEMLVVRLVFLKDMPSYESVLDLVNKSNLEEEKENNKTIDLNYKKKIIKNENENEINKISKDQVKNITQAKLAMPNIEPKSLTDSKASVIISSFEDLVFLTSKKKEIQLKYDLENNVNLVRFNERKIDISFNENLDKNFVRNLSEKLHKWTGNRWVITLTKELGQKTLAESKNLKKQELLEKEKKSKVYEKFKSVFSDVELTEVKNKDKD